MRAPSTALAICLTALGVVACDKAIPTAPANATLIVTASPLTIAPNGTSQIVVTALRANGQPVNPGTEIRLDTDLGTIDPIATTDERGIARATLRGTGAGGKATVTARSGAAEEEKVEVQIGALIETVTVVPSQASVEDGERAEVGIVVVVRDANGQPVQGANVFLTTDVGRLTSQGSTLTTDARGEVRDLLIASAEAVSAAPGDKITVRATAASGGATKTGEAVITVRPAT